MGSVTARLKKKVTSDSGCSAENEPDEACSDPSEELFNQLDWLRPAQQEERDLTASLLLSLKSEGKIEEIEEHVDRLSSEYYSAEELSISLTRASVPYLSSLSNPTHKALAKAYAIFYWIATNIEYDVSNFAAEYFNTSPDYVLRHRRTISHGYARLFESLSQDANLRVTTISGHHKQAHSDQRGTRPNEFSPSPGNAHSWNAILLDQVWHLVDCSRAAGSVGKFASYWAQEFDGRYFMTPPQQLVFTHWPSEQEWQLMNEEVQLDTMRNWIVLEPSYFELGIKLGEINEIILVDSSCMESTIKISLKVPQSLSIVATLEDWHTKCECKMLTFVDAKSSTDIVSVHAAAPSQGLYTLKLSVLPKDGSKSHFLTSYLIDYRLNVTPEHIRYPCVFTEKAAEDHFQSLKWSPENFDLVSISHVAESSRGTMKMSFEAKEDVEFVHFIAPGELSGNNRPEVRYHYYTSLEQSEDGRYQLSVLFPRQGLWTVCLMAQQEHHLLPLMYYEVNATQKSRRLSYPWLQSHNVEVRQSGPLSASGDDVFELEFVVPTLHTELISYLSRASDSDTKFDQCSVVLPLSQPHTHKLQVVFPEPGAWLIHILKRRELDQYSDLFSLYLEVDGCLPNAVFPIKYNKAMELFEAKFLDPLPLCVFPNDSALFQTRISVLSSVYLSVRCTRGWSLEDSISSSAPLADHSACLIPNSTSDGCYTLHASFPEIGEWLVAVYGTREETTDVVAEIKIKVDKNIVPQPNMAFPKLYPAFYEANMSIPDNCIPYTCSVADKLEFSLTTAHDKFEFKVVVCRSEKQYSNQGLVLPIDTANCYNLQCIFPSEGAWTVLLFAAEVEAAEEDNHYQPILQLYAQVRQGSAGYQYPWINARLLKKFRLRFLFPNLLLPSAVEGTPAQLIFPLHRPQEVELWHEVLDETGRLHAGASRLQQQENSPDYDFIAEFPHPGEWTVNLRARMDILYMTMNDSEDLCTVFSHTLTVL